MKHLPALLLPMLFLGITVGPADADTCDLLIDGWTISSQKTCKCCDSSIHPSCCYDIALVNHGTCNIIGFTLQLDRGKWHALPDSGLCGAPCCGAYFNGSDVDTCKETVPTGWSICNSDIRCVPWCPEHLWNGSCVTDTTIDDTRRSWCTKCGGDSICVNCPYRLTPGNKLSVTVCVVFADSVCDSVRIGVSQIVCCKNGGCGGTVNIDLPHLPKTDSHWSAKLSPCW